MLKLKHIDVFVNKGTPLERQILKGLNLELVSGGFLILMGDNGAGKSTLFNVISGSQQIAAGHIEIDGVDITHWPQHKRAALVSFVMQDPRLGTLEDMTIEENLSFAYLRGRPRTFHFFSSKVRRELFREKLSLLGMGLENRLGDLVAHLSGGQRQALSLIMAILRDSKILLLDEITAALDPKMSEKLMTLTHKLITAEKKTAMMITHNISHSQLQGAQCVYLRNGKTSREGSSDRF